MLYNLMDSNKNNLIKELKSKVDLSNEQLDEIFSEVGNFMRENLEDQAAKNPKGILDLINTGSEIKDNNYIVENLISKLSRDLSSKFDINPDKTKKASEFLAVYIINQISGQLSTKEKKINIKDLFTFLGLGSELEESAKISLEEPSGKIADYMKKIF